ncbi:MAG: ABC transporter ATP-binding protein [bacterium]|nr:ABC transporter ATP-binding protein [bacterium]
MEPIIKVKEVGKKYNIRHFQGGYIALRDVLADIIKSPFRFLKKKVKEVTGIDTKEDFWALRGASFEVKRGEIVGIIGRNGAGKSTLLKILTGITPPTTGEIVMHGRVASLLEVGTGFHPELSGRENIFLNGAILGMKKSEIAKNFDSIVEFAEIETFLDTPVKYYSSGMYVRLAFSVAAHMEPDILLVDEVLAVGDAEFQKKCLGKMEEVTKKQGRTILFVSHNMAAIERICNRCILIEKGQIKKDSADVRSVIKGYIKGSEGTTEGYIWSNPNNGRFENEWWKPLSIYATDTTDKLCDGPIRNDSRVELVIKGELRSIDPALTIGYALYSDDGTLLYWSFQTDGPEKNWPRLEKGPFTIKSEIPRRLLNEGVYRIELIGGLNDRTWLFSPGGNNPNINISIKGGLSDSPYWTRKRPGILAPELPWKNEK